MDCFSHSLDEWQVKRYLIEFFSEYCGYPSFLDKARVQAGTACTLPIMIDINLSKLNLNIIFIYGHPYALFSLKFSLSHYHETDALYFIVKALPQGVRFAPLINAQKIILTTRG